MHYWPGVKSLEALWSALWTITRACSATRKLLPVFDISGSDLMALGYGEGEALGKAKMLESKWMESGFEASKEKLLASMTS